MHDIAHLYVWRDSYVWHHSPSNVLHNLRDTCSVLQCVAVCCSVLQCVAVCCSVLQCVAVCCSVLQCVAVCCSVLQCVAVCCSMTWPTFKCSSNVPHNLRDTTQADILQFAASRYLAVCCKCVAVCCSVLQCVAVCCSVLQRVAVCCSMTWPTFKCSSQFKGHAAGRSRESTCASDSSGKYPQNVSSLLNLLGHTTRESALENSQKISSLLNVLCKMTTELTFENFRSRGQNDNTDLFWEFDTTLTDLAGAQQVIR